MSDITSLPAAWREHDAKIRPYVWSHRWLGLAQSALGLGLVAWWLTGGGAARLELRLWDAGLEGFKGWLAYFGLVGGAWSLASLPFAVGNQGIERHFGQSRQSWGGWLLDWIKGVAVGLVIGGLALGALYLAQSLSPAHWWRLGCVLLFLFSVVLAELAPILLIPIFFKLKPMGESSLKTRLLDLSRRHGVEVKEVYHLGLGEKTEKGNAAFTGLGKAKRILIGDTLYEKFPPDEVEAVFAHELGHQVNQDTWRGIFLGGILLWVGFEISAVLQPMLCARLGLSPGSPSGLLAFFVCLGFVNWPLGVLGAVHSRWRERLADSFAAGIGLSVPLATALERLTFQNRGLFRPNRLVEWLTYSHPAPWRRVMRLSPR